VSGRVLIVWRRTRPLVVSITFLYPLGHADSGLKVFTQE